MRWVVCTLSALLILPGVSAVTLSFTGDGSDHFVTTGAAANTLFAMSLDGPSGDTSFWTVLGSQTQNNPFYPTFEYLGDELQLHGDPITVYHYAAQAGAPAGCGLNGYLYSNGEFLGASPVFVPAQTGTDYDEFVFVFEGIEGTYSNLYFQAAQSANECGWLTIEHRWGSESYHGRVELGPRDYVGPAVVDGEEVVEDVEEVAKNITEMVTGDGLSIEHSFANATSDTYIFTWDANLSAIDIFMSSTVQNGTATLSIVDENGTSLFSAQQSSATNMQANSTGNQTMNVTAPPTAMVDDVAPGNWTVTIAYDAFVGQLSLDVLPHAAPAEDVHESTVDTPPVSKDSPGLGVLALLGVVAVVASRRRT